VVKYALEIKASAQKELDALDDKIFARIDPKILALADNPRPAGCKKLKGYQDQWHVRVGDWRIVYLIDDAAKLVSVMRIAHRREVLRINLTIATQLGRGAALPLESVRAFRV
jgi:mRNA interferase RelE/StbE